MGNWQLNEDGTTTDLDTVGMKVWGPPPVNNFDKLRCWKRVGEHKTGTSYQPEAKD